MIISRVKKNFRNMLNLAFSWVTNCITIFYGTIFSFVEQFVLMPQQFSPPSPIFALLVRDLLWTVCGGSTWYNITTVFTQHGITSLLFSLNMSFTHRKRLFFTLNELSSPLFFHQHGFQSTLFSLNTAYHLH